MVHLSGITADKVVNKVTKEERSRLLHLFKEMKFQVDSLHGFSKAIVTSGGVSLKEIDPRSLRSRLIRNLYFAGEVIDLDGPTGGYNLQMCWSTGHLAGVSAAR
jgi:predicted flavoprotein YhiN